MKDEQDNREMPHRYMLAYITDELFLDRPQSASLAAVPAVIAGHRCTCGPFREGKSRDPQIVSVLPKIYQRIPCGYDVPNSINTVLRRYLRWYLYLRVHVHPYSQYYSMA